MFIVHRWIIFLRVDQDQRAPTGALTRVPDKVHIFISIMPISSPNPWFDHLLESSQDDSNKWPNIGFGEEIKQIQFIEVHFTHLIWSSGSYRSPLNRVFTV